jgi:hypothetical protein
VSDIVIKLKKRHLNQQHIIETAKRFNVLKCGRRFGKTSLAEELIIEPALDGFPVAYYCPTYKDLNDFWINIVGICRDVIQSKNEQLKQIRLITGGVIDMWSLDEPDSGRGRKYKRVVIDECEKAKKLDIAYKGTIRATLTDLIGDCWFLSTPKFGQTYFKELYNNAHKTTDWQAWTFSTYDNPFMNKGEIDSAKATLEDVYFRCEYLAQDVDLKGLRWAFAYDKDKHTGLPVLNKAHEVYLSFDFNRNPICCSVIQHYNDTINVIETIKLENSDIYALCDYINAYYPNCLFMITGDATGQSSSAMVKDNINYYTIIKSELNVGSNQLKIPPVNPRIEENQVLVNSLLANYKVIIHENKASGLHFDLANVKISADNKIEKSVRTDATQQADALDTFRYFCNTFMNWYLKLRNI